jgi:FecR-like protein
MRTITTRTCGPLCICALLLAVTSTVANAQTRIGTANSVQPEASGGVAGTLSAGSGVHANETVRTGSSGRAGLQFHDQSNLSVGPSSQVRLDKFVYDPNKGTGSTVIEATRGTFRFTTGSQNKGEVKIKTQAGFGVGYRLREQKSHFAAELTGWTGRPYAPTPISGSDGGGHNGGRAQPLDAARVGSR